jgi:NhaP-type Na+/H+ or K+/H+ antiporter
LFIALATFAVRPPAIVLSLLGTELRWREKLVAGWFGPKGFASVVYGLLILQAGLNRLAHIVGLCVITSIVIFSSTDILVGRWFQKHQLQPGPESGIRRDNRENGSR